MQLSNLHVYLAIAESALAESKQSYEAARRPKSDGQEGFVITYDPRQLSFRNSLIAITFAGVYLDALLYIEGMNRLGAAGYTDKIDRLCYEKKLRLYGVIDTQALTACKYFRESRNDLVHEKALVIEDDGIATKFHAAQDLAEAAVSFVQSVPSLLNPLTAIPPMARHSK